MTLYPENSDVSNTMDINCQILKVYSDYWVKILIFKKTLIPMSLFTILHLQILTMISITKQLLISANRNKCNIATFNKII
jgi:hypothetical protein